MENRLIRNYIRNLTINLDVAYFLSGNGVFEVHECDPNIYYQFVTSFDNRKFLYCSKGGSYIRETHNMSDIHENIMTSKYQNFVKFENASWVLIKSYEHRAITKLDVYGDIKGFFPAKPNIEELEYVIREKIPNRKLKQLKLVR